MASMELLAAKKATDRNDLNARLARASEFQQNCIDDSTHAIEANPHLAQAYLTRGLANRSTPEKALADFNAAIREDPRMFRAYFNRGVLFFNNHHVDAAIKDFEEAERLQPDASEIDNRLYQCYAQKADRISMNKYYLQWQEKNKRVVQRMEQDLEVGDLIGARRKVRLTSSPTPISIPSSKPSETWKRSSTKPPKRKRRCRPLLATGEPGLL